VPLGEVSVTVKSPTHVWVVETVIPTLSKEKIVGFARLTD